VPCPTCGAETRQGQRFCMDCGALLDAGAAVSPTTELPVVDHPAIAPTVAVPLATAGTPVVRPVAGPGAAVPLMSTTEAVAIKIVEQTTPIPIGAPPAGAEAGGVVWRPLSVDPWPTPQSQPTIVGTPLRPVPLAILGLLAVVAGIVGSVATTGSYRFADGTHARFTLNDLRSNSLAVMLAACAVIVLGIALAIGHQRIGAGLAGGAAIAVAGLAAMDVALVVSALHESRHSGLATGSVTITWEPGFYAIIATGVLALGAWVVALGAWREGGASAHPLVAVIGVLAVITMIVGTLAPTGSQKWSDNLHVPGFSELPSALRLIALGLMALGALVGFASRRRWALGMAVGSTAALAAQWIGAVNPPSPDHRGGPGIAITPLVDNALAVFAAGLAAVVLIAVVGFVVATWRS
jgi:hypothetical protein